MQEFLLDANHPRNPREGGVHYAGQHYTNPRLLDGLSRAAYWDTTKREPMTKVADRHITPSDSLTAFIEGPTFADCGAVLYAGVLDSLEQQLGTDRFNEIFGHPMARFVITPTLYETLEEDSRLGNPLMFLFDRKQGELTEDDIEVGDILHIAGVRDYQEHYPEGYVGGWNVVCVGENNEGQKLYMGFGADEFPEPRTYEEVVGLLLDGFYKDIEHTPEEKSETPIGGITVRLRLDTDKVKQLAEAEIDKGWWQSEATISDVHENQTEGGSLNYLAQISPETQNNTLDTYETTTPETEHMINIAKKFAELVPSSDTALGLVMTGTAGIGKTHLAHAIAQEVSKTSQVSYLDANMIGELFGDIGREKGAMPSETEFISRLKDLIGEPKLLVLDDFNGHILERLVLEEVLQLAQEQGVSFIVTSNESVPLSHHAPQIEVSDTQRNVLVIDDLVMESRRKGWWELDAEHPPKNSLEAIRAFAVDDLDQSRGVFVSRDETEQSLLEIDQLFDQVTTYGNFEVPLNASDLGEADVYVFDFSEPNSVDLGNFLRLLPKLISQKQRFVILSSDREKLNQELSDRFADNQFRQNKQRLVDRLNSVVYGLEYEDTDQGESRVTPRNTRSNQG